MTTQQSYALYLADELELGTFVPNEAALRQRAAAELRRLHAYCQELESQVILDCMTHVQNSAEIEHVAGDVSKNGAGLNMGTQHARITELEAQLASIGAGGVSGPLTGRAFDAADMATASAQGFRDGVASLAASAGSEPVAIYHGRCVIDCGAHGHLDMELLKMIPAGSKLYTHTSPPEGMAGWQPIETAPRDGTEILLYAPACVYEGAPVEARITYGKWLEPSDTPRIKYQDGFAPDIEWDEFDAHWVSWDGGFTPEHSPTHWMPLPPAPGPADGESNG